MADSIIGFIGFGLIEGSTTGGLERACPGTRIVACMRTHSKLEQAKADRIVDVTLDGIGEGLKECSLIFLCTSVECNAQYLSVVRPFLKLGALVTNVDNMKAGIHEQVVRLGMKGRFVSGHPMAGSEKTGYENSTDHLLKNAYCIIAPTATPTDSQVERLMAVAKIIGSIPVVLDYGEHSSITAAVSHLPHVITPSLVNLVKDLDNGEEMMKWLTADGFKDIARVASLSPEMWGQICMTDRENLAVILGRYVASLNQTLGEAKSRDRTVFHELFETSGGYRSSIPERAKGSVSPDYFFTVDVVDEPGSISTLSATLASRGISIKSIDINHNRKHDEGVLGISFYGEGSVNRTQEQLEKYHYDMMRDP